MIPHDKSWRPKTYIVLTNSMELQRALLATRAVAPRIEAVYDCFWGSLIHPGDMQVELDRLEAKHRGYPVFHITMNTTIVDLMGIENAEDAADRILLYYGELSHLPLDRATEAYRATEVGIQSLSENLLFDGTWRFSF